MVPRDLGRYYPIYSYIPQQNQEQRISLISHLLEDVDWITLKISITAHQRYPTMDVRGGGSNSSTSCPASRNLSTQICTALLQTGLVCMSAFAIGAIEEQDGRIRRDIPLQIPLQ